MRTEAKSCLPLRSFRSGCAGRPTMCSLVEGQSMNADPWRLPACVTSLVIFCQTRAHRIASLGQLSFPLSCSHKLFVFFLDCVTLTPSVNVVRSAGCLRFFSAVVIPLYTPNTQALKIHHQHQHYHHYHSLTITIVTTTPTTIRVAE